MIVANRLVKQFCDRQDCLRPVLPSATATYYRHACALQTALDPRSPRSRLIKTDRYGERKERKDTPPRRPAVRGRPQRTSTTLASHRRDRFISTILTNFNFSLPTLFYFITLPLSLTWDKAVRRSLSRLLTSPAQSVASLYSRSKGETSLSS